MLSVDVVKAGACVTLVVLAGCDLRMRRLPNAAVAAVAALYFVNAAVTGFGRASCDIHVAAGVAALAVAAVMFRWGWLGGGDVKLAAAVFLWAGPQSWPVLVVVSTCGLLVALVVLAVAGMQRIAALAGVSLRLDWIAPARGVPYGVALALGGIVAVLLQPTSGHRAIFAMLQRLV
ncbi:prepilin peptidase [Paraburkholderia tagetis]|uniref:Prepilin peptidase n=1 Tax=Paraburkholderia tagetis TaxID=2913261 RepID=A0A9X1UIQ4_9BURK|nr:prepilin peptidase [Paraburkholderia tagetis]MCG5075277.1 prepilin peptidase [Paraburkholderia tagetis]